MFDDNNVWWGCRTAVCERHAARTHLYKIETGQQADAVFGQDPLLSRRHVRASKYPNRSKIWRGKNGWAIPGVLPGSGALHTAVWSRMLRTTAAHYAARAPGTQTCTNLYLCQREARDSVLCMSSLRAVRCRTEPHRRREGGREEERERRRTGEEGGWQHMVMTADIRLFRGELRLAQRMDEGRGGSRGQLQKAAVKTCS